MPHYRRSFSNRVRNARDAGLSCRRASRPAVESLERRQVLSFAGGTGAVVTALAGSADRTSIVISFDGPLVSSTAQDVGNYQVNALGKGNPQVITSTGASMTIVA